MAPRKRFERCQFCGSHCGRSITGEHIFPDWICQELLRRNYRWYDVRTYEDGRRRHWRQRTLADKAPIVCENCNSGWMGSRIEGPCASILKPLIFDDRPGILDTPVVKQIAQWAFLRALVVDVDSSDQAYFSAKERRMFMQSATVPKGVQIWMARCSMLRAQTDYGAGKSEILPPFRSAMSLSIVSFAVWNVAFQIKHARWVSRLVRREKDPPHFTQQPDWDRESIPIWPGAVPLDWPPPLRVDDTRYGAFTRRWFDGGITDRTVS